MEGVNSTMVHCKNFCKCHNKNIITSKTKLKKNNFLKIKQESVLFVTKCMVIHYAIREKLIGYPISQVGNKR
jgi:hypothetical protein